MIDCEHKLEDIEEIRCGPVRRFLRFISLGQYETKFYSDGNESYATSLGGVFTIVIIASIILYATLVMIDVINRVDYHLDQEAGEIRLFTIDKNENATIMT